MSDNGRCKLARALSCGVFLVLIVGQYTPDRLGLNFDLPIPIPVWLVMVLLALLAGPILDLRSGPAKYRVPLVGSTIALFLVLAISSMWSDAGAAVAAPLIDLGVMAALLLLTAAALEACRAHVVSTLMTLSAVSGSAFAVAGLVLGASSGRLALFGGGPNVYARITGIGIIGILYLVATHRRTPWIAVLLVPMGAATVLSGSRGAMLGTALALIIFAFTLPRSGWKRLSRACFAIVPALGVGYAVYGEEISRTISERIVRLTIEEGYSSGRDVLWRNAWQSFTNRPLVGGGLSSSLNAAGTYPHNMILEIAADSGIVGLVALMVVLCGAVLCLVRSGIRDLSINAPFAVAALVATASMVSGTYYDTRYLWVFLLVACSHVPGSVHRDSPLSSRQPTMSTEQ